LTASGGQSSEYFQKIALSLGFVISIQEFARHTVSMTVSTPINGVYWSFGWMVKVISATTPENLQALKAIFNRYKPAHTILNFS
jgi:uncharacterized protein YmfQ (DUF2313 family)